MRSTIHCLRRYGKVTEWSPLMWLTVSAIACLSLFCAALSLNSTATFDSRLVIKVYCASAVVDPLNKILDQFNSSKLATSKNMVANIVRSGGSGALAGQLSAEAQTGVPNMADVFICADSNRIVQLIDQNVIEDSFPIAAQFPVIAVRYDSDLNLNQINDLQSLLNLEIKLGVGSVSSAIGFETTRVANLKGCEQLLQTRKTAEFENVMSMAQALSLGSIDAAIVWDSTVAQFNQTDRQSIKFVAYLDSVVPGTGSSNRNVLENNTLATENLTPNSRSDKLSEIKSNQIAGSKCFVEVGRSKSTSSHADLFFNYLRVHRNKLIDEFVDAGFSNDLLEAPIR